MNSALQPPAAEGSSGIFNRRLSLSAPPAPSLLSFARNLRGSSADTWGNGQQPAPAGPVLHPVGNLPF